MQLGGRGIRCRCVRSRAGRRSCQLVEPPARWRNALLPARDALIGLIEKIASLRIDEALVSGGITSVQERYFALKDVAGEIERGTGTYWKKFPNRSGIIIWRPGNRRPSAAKCGIGQSRMYRPPKYNHDEATAFFARSSPRCRWKRRSANCSNQRPNRPIADQDLFALGEPPGLARADGNGPTRRSADATCGSAACQPEVPINRPRTLAYIYRSGLGRKDWALR